MRCGIKNKLIRFITYAIASTDETIDHLETLFETGSLEDKEIYICLSDKINLSGKKLIKFLESIERHRISEK